MLFDIKIASIKVAFYVYNFNVIKNVNLSFYGSLIWRKYIFKSQYLLQIEHLYIFIFK